MRPLAPPTIGHRPPLLVPNSTLLSTLKKPHTHRVVSWPQLAPHIGSPLWQGLQLLNSSVRGQQVSTVGSFGSSSRPAQQLHCNPIFITSWPAQQQPFVPIIFQAFAQTFPTWVKQIGAGGGFNPFKGLSKQGGGFLFFKTPPILFSFQGHFRLSPKRLSFLLGGLGIFHFGVGATIQHPGFSGGVWHSRQPKIPLGKFWSGQFFPFCGGPKNPLSPRPIILGHNSKFPFPKTKAKGFSRQLAKVLGISKTNLYKPFPLFFSNFNSGKGPIQGKPSFWQQFFPQGFKVWGIHIPFFSRTQRGPLFPQYSNFSQGGWPKGGFGFATRGGSTLPIWGGGFFTRGGAFQRFLGIWGCCPHFGGQGSFPRETPPFKKN